MGASSSRYGDDYESYSAPDILSRIKQSEDESKSRQYEVEVNSYIDNILANYNNRDRQAINDDIDQIKDSLSADIEGSVSTRFGGSLSKNTHINGISDIDTLVILNDTDLNDATPQQVLRYFYEKLKGEYGDSNVKKGDISVTVHCDHGDIQLLPAIKYKTGLKIPDGDEWSGIVKPTVFARRLTILNQRLDNRLVPVIKIIKGINSQFPESMRLKGYHIESLALQVFEAKVKFGERPRNKEMIITFFKDAASLVKNPIKDMSNQSQYVDDYLGKKGNLKRVMASEILDRTYRKLEMADSGKITSVWTDIISKE